MNEETQRWLLSYVDSNGNPKLDPATLDKLSNKEIEGFPEDDPVIEHEEIYEDDQFFLEDVWHIDPTDEQVEKEQVDVRSRVIGFTILIAIFLLALLPRLYVLFFVTDLDNPGAGWYNDTYHHWQIAYLSKEIGFSKGFLRLWDFKGMEYFWGLFHPLLLSILFTLTGSIDILIPRLTSVVFGSASVVLLYLLLRRYFNLHVALAGTLLATILPVSIFADAAGLLQPIAMFMLLLGLFLWPRQALWAGVVWGFAAMTRAEYWVFGAGLVAISVFADEKVETKASLAFGWFLPVLAYMKYMVVQTGNPIYPVYWNFMGNAAGEWLAGSPLGVFQINMMWAWRIIFVLAAVAAIWILRKRKESYLFLLYGLGNILFVGIMFGFSKYIHGILPRILVARLLIVPYLYVGIFISIFLLYMLLKLRLGRLWLTAGWTVMLALVGLSQFAWGPIMDTYERQKGTWAENKLLAEEVASYYDDGTLLIPENNPLLTYALVRYQGFSAEQLLGQMYDPFFYFKEDNPFENWSKNREVVANWLKEHDIRLILYAKTKNYYNELVEREEGWFKPLASPRQGLLELYQVMPLNSY